MYVFVAKGNELYQSANLPIDDPHDYFERQKREGSDCSPIVCIYFTIYLIFQMHACYTLFFTAYLFHTSLESILGLLFGMGICLVTYEFELILALVKRRPDKRLKWRQIKILAFIN